MSVRSEGGGNKREGAAFALPPIEKELCLIDVVGSFIFFIFFFKNF